jgi:putative protease
VKHAHTHHVKVFLTLNAPFMVKTMEKELNKHIRTCIDHGVDAFIVSDFGILSMIKKLNVDIPLIASTYTISLNYEAVDFLRKLGFSRVVLERHLLPHEIAQIVQRSKIEVELLMHGIGCSNLNASCYFFHYRFPEMIRAWRSTSTLQAPCTLQYDLYDAHTNQLIGENVAIQDALVACSLCHLPELINTGVAGLKIAGRSLSTDYQINTTKLYRKLIDQITRGDLKEFYEKIDSIKQQFLPLPKEILTLQEMFCEQKRCYYSPLFHAPYKIPLSWTAWTKFKFRTRMVASKN